MKQFKHKKQLGQNFLKDKNIARKIIDSANIKEDDLVWEIGPGKGILTEFLEKKKASLTLFEIDERLIGNLKEQFPHTAVICDDILKVDWGKELNENIKIVSNLPYQITSPFLFKVAKFAEKIDKTVVMIQREVADRIVAKPGTKNYGILSLKLQYFFDIKYLFGVKRHLFIPAPNVDSAVISLTSRSDKPEIENLKLFWKIVELSFRNRRKMLRKNLRQIIANDKIPEIAKDSKIDLKRRGESLSEEEFIILYRSVKSFL